MRARLCGLFCAAVLTVFVPLLRGGDPEKLGIAARTQGTGVIKCSPDGREGTKTLPEGLKQLKEGMVLHLMPGDYEEAPLESYLNNIVIQGEPGGFCAVDIQLTGKNVVIRNYWGNYVSLRGDSVIVDSVIGTFKTSYDDNKAQFHIYNSCLHSAYIGDFNHKMFVKNCTFLQNSKDGYCMSMWHGGAITIQKSIFYSESRCFRIDGRPSISVEDSILYGALSLALEDTSDSRKQGVDAKDIKEFKKITKLKTKGEIILDKPVFALKPDYSEPTSSRKGFQGVTWLREGHDDDLKIFKLDESSPGKDSGFGAFLNEDGFPVAKGK